MAMSLMTSALFALPASAQSASVFDDVDECDLLAAHPSDPERLADGVADDAIVPRLAVTACEAAAKRSPEIARFAFQLGRAYAAANRAKDAALQYQKAADQDYGAAFAYLGDAYQFGRGVTADVPKALEAYKKAAAKGFAPADGQIEMLTFDRNMYVVPAIGMLYDGDASTLRSADTPALQAYLFGFVMALGSECGPVLPPKAVSNLYSRRYPQTWTPEADMPVNVSVMGSVAEYDAKLFLRRHGCEGPVTDRIKTNLNRLYVDSN
jgi:tetratricopeptide (TPR) repeat protein